jgi:hypothetical protein
MIADNREVPAAQSWLVLARLRQPLPGSLRPPEFVPSNRHRKLNMSNGIPERFSLDQYAEPAMAPAVFRLVVRPDFAPLDLNVAFLARSGWMQSSDRLRFHYSRAKTEQPAHPLAEALATAPPHVLVRRLDREEDRIVVLRIFVSGEIEVLSNDKRYAHDFVTGLFLECPPSFHSADALETHGEWSDDAELKAMFAGMVAGARGWDPAHGIPDNIRESLEEARKSLEIANYRSCVVMSRRTLEAVLTFGYPRLLNKPVGKSRLTG